MRVAWTVWIACVAEALARSPSEVAVPRHPPAPCVSDVAELPGIDLTDPRWQGEVVVILKAHRRLMRVLQGRVVEGQCWPIGLGMRADAHIGPKQREGDLKTPEGWYRTSDKPTSRYHAAIALHYPNAADAEAGLARGVISVAQRDAVVSALARDAKPPQQTALGGEILIHGGGASSDWTLGCVALEDADIDALRVALPADLRFDVLVLP